MTWSTEIALGFGDLLSAVGVGVQWVNEFGALQTNADGSLPLALLKQPGQMILSDMQITDEYAIEYRDADFVGLTSGALIGVQSMTFRVKEVLQGDDPVLKTARLARAKV